MYETKFLLAKMIIMKTTENHPTCAPELVPARMLNEYTYCPRLC